MKILAVDDDILILELLTETLRAAGYDNVQTATSAVEAVQRMTTTAEPFDCFLLDIVMPDLDGVALCRCIRKSNHYRVAPIVMMTSMIEKRHIDEAFRAGASDYVTKPFEVIELVTRVRLAERQVELNRALQESNAAIKAVRDQPGGGFRIALTDPILLDDVDRLIDVLALENYLLQLSRGHLATTSVVAFRIFEVATVYERCSAILYRDVLADVAESILAALSGQECILAHAGNGAFSGVIANGRAFDVEEIELMINTILHRLELLDDQGRPLEVRVSVGTPKHVGFMKSGRVAVSMLHAAIDDLRWNGRQPGIADAEVRHTGQALADPLSRSA